MRIWSLIWINTVEAYGTSNSPVCYMSEDGQQALESSFFLGFARRPFSRLQAYLSRSDDRGTEISERAEAVTIQSQSVQTILRWLDLIENMDSQERFVTMEWIISAIHQLSLSSVRYLQITFDKIFATLQKINADQELKDMAFYALLDCRYYSPRSDLAKEHFAYCEELIQRYHLDEGLESDMNLVKRERLQIPEVSPDDEVTVVMELKNEATFEEE